MNKIKMKASLANGKSVEVEFADGDADGMKAAMDIIRSVTVPQSAPKTAPKPEPVKKQKVAVVKSNQKVAVKKTKPVKRKLFGAKKVVIAGKTYESITAAARTLSIGEKRIRNAAKSGKKLDGMTVKFA